MGLAGNIRIRELELQGRGGAQRRDAERELCVRVYSAGESARW